MLFLARYLISMIIVFMVALPVFPFSQESAAYGEIAASIRQRDLPTAFALMHSFAVSYPHSRHLEKVIFSMGEYYYHDGAYYDARQSFDRFLKDHPDSKARLFAMAYLYEIAKIKGSPQDVERLAREIITFMNVSLLFRDYKSYGFTSFLQKRYKAVYFIDKVEFYIGDELFTSLAY